MKTCNRCNIVLEVGVNWSEGCAKNGTYTCSDCRKEYQRQYHQRNKERVNRLNRERYQKNREKIIAQQRYYQIWKKYGLTKEEYDEMMKSPCQICGSDEDKVVDHCHNTGKIRGTLCRKCNAGIGLLGDTAESVQRAVDYLRGE